MGTVFERKKADGGDNALASQIIAIREMYEQLKSQAITWLGFKADQKPANFRQNTNQQAR